MNNEDVETLELADSLMPATWICVWMVSICLDLCVLEQGMFRVLIKREYELALNRTWSIAPENDVPWEGRDRLKAWKVLHCRVSPWKNSAKIRLDISTDNLRVTVHQPLWLEWEYLNQAGEWQLLASDRQTSAYLLNAHGDGVGALSASL